MPPVPFSRYLRQATDAVAEMGGTVDAQKLAEKLHISFDAARLRLARAARQGLLVRVKLGEYRAAHAPSTEETGKLVEPDE